MNISDIILRKRRFVRALLTMAIVALIALVSALSSVALAANLAEEVAKLGTANVRSSFVMLSVPR